MRNPNTINEVHEIGMWQALYHDAHRVDVQDERSCEEFIAGVQKEFHDGLITQEMVKILMEIICHGK